MLLRRDCVLLLLVSFVLTQTCEITIDITNGTKINNTFILYDGVYFELNHTVKQPDGSVFGCICEYRTCIRKCCPENQYFHNETLQCQPGRKEAKPQIHIETDPINATHHFIIDEIPFVWCNGSKMVLTPHLREDDAFALQKSGHLLLTNFNDKLEPLQFCGDYLEDSKGFGVIDCLLPTFDTQEKFTGYVLSVGKFYLIIICGLLS